MLPICTERLHIEDVDTKKLARDRTSEIGLRCNGALPAAVAQGGAQWPSGTSRMPSPLLLACMVDR